MKGSEYCKLYRDSDTLDYKLAFHCAPAVEGIKCANLISLKKPLSARAAARLEELEQGLRARGVTLYPLIDDDSRLMLLVCCDKLLQLQLAEEANRKVLARFGYPDSLNPSVLLARLAERITQDGGDYPHEIGVFLGYPTCDVEGFIQNQGRRFQLCRYWKVYGDAENAERTFSAYDRVRSHYCGRVAGGEKIQSIYCEEAAV
ncbi:MAG: DUF3793 family protein [Oscillospiraceae bacterium]